MLFGKQKEQAKIFATDYIKQGYDPLSRVIVIYYPDNNPKTDEEIQTVTRPEPCEHFADSHLKTYSLQDIIDM